MRVAICQPLIPAYRVAVFEAIEKNCDTSLTVFAGGDLGGLRNTAARVGFCRKFSRLRIFSLFGATFKFQMAPLVALLSRSYDIVVISWDIRYILLPVAIVVAKIVGIPILLWGHGYSKRSGRLATCVRNTAGRLADGVITYDFHTSMQLIDHYKFSAGRVFTAQNAIDQGAIVNARQYWTENSAELVTFQKRNKLHPGRTIIFVSRLEEDNRVDLLLQATKKLITCINELSVVVIGEGAEEARLRAMTSNLELSSAVHFVGAVYDEIQLALWMMSAAVFCYPRNMGLSILHAFGYGLPVITGDNIQTHGPEVRALQEGENGLMFKDGDVDDLVLKLKKILLDIELRERMSKNALEVVSEKYTLQNMIAGFCEAFKTLGRY